MRPELTHRFATPLRNGFDYIAEPRNWPEYWFGAVRHGPQAVQADRAFDSLIHIAAARGGQRTRAACAAPAPHQAST